MIEKSYGKFIADDGAAPLIRSLEGAKTHTFHVPSAVSASKLAGVKSYRGNRTTSRRTCRMSPKRLKVTEQSEVPPQATDRTRASRNIPNEHETGAKTGPGPEAKV